MTRFLIHIGPYKTASTYIQARLLQNIDILKASRIHLAQIWSDNASKPSHTGLVHRLNSERRHELQPLFDSWRNSNFETIVISCEDLSAMSLEPIKVLMLRELIHDARATIVFYVRRWSDLLSSEWREYVKQGSTLSFLEVLTHNLRNPIKSRIINIDSCLSVYAGLFGIDSMKVISYDEVVASGDDIFEHFVASCLGKIHTAPAVSHRLNQSLTASQTELMRLFNVLGHEAKIDSSRLLRFFYLEHPPAPLRNLLIHLKSFETTIDLSDDDPPVRGVLNENRRQYASCAVPPVSQNAFSEPKIVQAKFVRPEYALCPGFTEAVRGLWTALLNVERPQ